MKHPNAVVLAGGRSSRMQREKAFLRLRAGGRTLLSKQVELLRSLRVHQLLLSARRDMRRIPAGLTVIHDAAEGLGPLGGIMAAARVDPERPLLVLAVDMPLIDESILSRLLGIAEEAGGAAPRFADRWEPLCAVYPPGTFYEIEAMARNRSARGGAAMDGRATWGRRWSPSVLLDRLHARGVVRAVPIDVPTRRRFVSWNHPRDLPPAVRASAVVTSRAI